MMKQLKGNREYFKKIENKIGEPSRHNMDILFSLNKDERTAVLDLVNKLKRIGFIFNKTNFARLNITDQQAQILERIGAVF